MADTEVATEEPRFENIQGADEHFVPVPDKVLDVTSLGKGVKFVGRRTVTLNHKKAEELIDTPEVPWERPVRDRHVADLVKTMQQGLFMPELVVLVFAKWKGKSYRLNGRHTSWAVLNMPADFSMQVSSLEYECGTEEDVRQLYNSIDRNAPRTMGNQIVSALYETDGFEGVSRRILQRLSEGLAIWVWESTNERKNHNAADRSFLIKTKYREVCQRVAAFMADDQSIDARKLYRAAVVAAMLATFDACTHTERGALEFWRSVRGAVGFTDETDPRRRLHMFLRSDDLKRNNIASARAKLDSDYTYRACVHCWNNWRKGGRMKVLSVPGERPKAV